MTTDSEIETSAVVRAQVPLLAKATPLIGHFQIRNRGTLGGSLAHADPSAEYPAVAAALDATMVMSSTSWSAAGARRGLLRVHLHDRLADEEILTSVEFPVWPGASGFGAYEVARRHGDFALVGAMAGIQLDRSQVVKAAVVLFGVAATAHRAGAAEAALVGSSAGAIDLADVGRVAASDLDPPNDVHASALIGGRSRRSWSNGLLARHSRRPAAAGKSSVPARRDGEGSDARGAARYPRFPGVQP